jgi:hypothetical protein
VHLFSLLPLSHLRPRRQRFVRDEPIDQIVRLAEAVHSVAAPTIFVGPLDDHLF